VSKTTPILLHLHLPKTAGGSLNRIFYTEVASPDYPTDRENHILKGIYHYSSPQSFVTLKKPDLEIHPAAINILKTRNLKAVLGHFTFGIHRYLPKTSTYITLLRNPVDRIISLYYHYTRKMSKQSEGKLTLDQFLTGYPLPGMEPQQTQLLTDNDQTRRISGLQPRSGKCTNAMLEQAKKNLESNFSVVGVTDQFDEMVVLLKRKFGWLSPHKYWPVHVGRVRSERSQIDMATIDRIRDGNRFDLALYNFAHKMMDDTIEKSGQGFQFDMNVFRSQRKELMECVNHRNPKVAKRVETALGRVKRDSQL